MTTSILIAASVLILARAEPTTREMQEQRAAVEVVRQDQRVGEAVREYDHVEFKAHFSDEFRVWIVEILSDEREIGFASVKDGQVVEFDLKEAAKPRVRSPAELIDDHPRVRELRERFPEASTVLAREPEGERRGFEIVVDGREVAAGFVNVETGEVQFLDENENEGQRDEAELRESGGFWRALGEVCRFPVEGRGLVWFAAAVTLLAVFPFRRLFRMQSLDLLVLLAVFPLSLVVWEHRFETFLALFALSGYLLVRCVWRSFRGAEGVEPPNLRSAALAGMLVVVAAAHVQAVFTRGPDDSGIWTVFGGQYLWRHGKLPYGRIGEGGTYGPVLYGLAAPLTHVLPPTAPADKPGERLVVDRRNFERVGYRNCDFLPAKVLALVFDVLLLAGLIGIGRQACCWNVGLALALVYAVNGLTIQRDLLFVSHLAPTACVVLAIAARRFPAVSGTLLALGAGVLFWPAFLIPTWFAYFARLGRGPLIRCGGAILVVGVATLAAVHFYTEPLEDRGPLQVFVDSTWGHQEGGGPYSHSEFGLWGQWIARNPDHAATITNVKRTVRWLYAALCLALPAMLYLRRRPMTPHALLGISAALALGLQFWKTHGGGLYTGWYFPLAIATLLIPQTESKATPSTEAPPAEKS